MKMAKPQQYKARVSERYYLTENEKFLLIRLELVEPNQIEYLAGQYVSIKVNEEGERRSYSIASTPDVKHGVTVVAEIIPGGKGSEYLGGLTVGEEVEMLGPFGKFRIQNSEFRMEKRLFVATGSGIVPIYAMINDLLINRGETGPMRLHWGMRSEEDLFWFDNFERLSQEHPNFVFDQVLSQPSEEWSLCTGHVQDCLQRDFGGDDPTSPEASLGAGEWEAYVCGNQKLVEGVRGVLEKLGMKKDKIYCEKYM